METQIVKLHSSTQITSVALPHLNKNFLHTGLTTDDVKYQVKAAAFPSQFVNIQDGDYVEIYGGFTAKLTGFNTNDGSVWAEEIYTFQLPTDMSTYTGVKIYLDAGDDYNNVLTGIEIVEQLNEKLKQQLQIYYETYYETYDYDDIPEMDYTQQIYYDMVTLNLMNNGYFEFDITTGKIKFTFTPSTTTGNIFEIPAETGIVIDSLSASQYAIPVGTEWDGTNIEVAWEICSFEFQIHAGRENLEHRQHKLSQIFGAQLNNFSYTLGSLSGAYSSLVSSPFILAESQWNEDARGAFPSDFCLFFQGFIDAKPVKRVYVHSTLGSNMWDQYGAKSQCIYVHSCDKHIGDEQTTFAQQHQIYASKEHIQAAKNGFDLILKDQFGYDPQIIGQFYIEISFFM